MPILTQTRILVADTSPERFEVYKRILEPENFELKFVDQSDLVFEIYMNWQPDLVILDLNLCQHEQCDLVGQIKLVSDGEMFVPVLLASDESEAKLLQYALAQKVDGFLKVPFSDSVLLLKVFSLLRIRQLYTELKQSRDEFHKLHLSLQQEHKNAERIYEKFVRPSSQEIAGFKSYISAVSIFNGDLLLARIQPSGDVVILLGDFTGHGLSASIGVIPVADIFNSMIDKARCLPEIIVEMNSKLHQILPAHLFFGCAILQVSPSQRKARVYNCGMPDVLMRCPGGKNLRFPSSNLPLGVVDSKRLDLHPATVELNGDEVFYLLTDGVIESHNPHGEMFGYHRVEQAISQAGGDIESLIQSVSGFCEGGFFEDDISIAELHVSDVLHTSYLDSLQNLPKAASWKLHFFFGHQTLKHMDHPMKGVVDMIMQMQPVPIHKERIFIILNELFNNALDHGVLQLDSALKQKKEGFLKFLTKRQKKLENLKTGFIEIHVQHKPLGEYEGELTIKMHDSGEGFDYKHLQQSQQEHPPIFSGRGILLIRALCQSLEYQGKGNEVKAVYRWNLRPEN